MAFLAMMIAALAAINQYTSQMQAYDEAYRTEFELMANALVVEQLEVIDMTTDWDDLEDWDGDEIDAEFEVHNGDIEFTLAISVQFVDDDGTPSESETSNKEVAIQATSDRYTVALVTLTRVISE